MPRENTPRSLEATRARNLCDEHGLIPAIRASLAAGRVPGYTSPQAYLDDVLEGWVPDDIASFGWAPCRHQHRCARTGRCQRYARGPVTPR